MPFCPNPECDHRRRLGQPAEFLDGVTVCPDCGSALSEATPRFETVREPEKVDPQGTENVTGWTCPQCGSLNREDLALCSCGHDLNRPAPAVQQKPGNIIGWKCPHCDLTNHEDTVRGSCGYDPGEPKQRELALKFHGSGPEYFRIWIVNLCLTLLTLGIFSAWAKVRKKRYFYSHTTVDGTPFQYLGQPVPIFKGRVIAAVAFIAYYLSTHFFTSWLPYVFVAGAVLAPWVIVRSAAFNARYSAFRNMTFHFDGGYLDALKALYVLGIVPVFFLGMMFNWWGKPAVAAVIGAVLFFSFPWWLKRLKGFLISHSSYGNRNGTFSATGGQFFGVYLRSGLIMVGVLIVVGVFSAMFLASMTKSMSKMPPPVVWLFAAPMYAGYVLAYAYLQAHSTNLVWNNTWLGPLRFQSTLSGRGMAKLYVTNAVAIVASLGLLIPWAVMRTLKYRADHMRVLQKGELAEFEGSDMSAVEAVGAETVDFFDMDLSL